MITDALNPAVVKTELDAVFYQEFDKADVGRGYATVFSPLFKQMTMDNAAYIMQTYGGSGFWGKKGETQNVQTQDVVFKNKQSFFAETWADARQISKEFFDDNMHDAYTMIVKDMAENARETRNLIGFGVYRAAFTGVDAYNGTSYLTADGVSWINSAHVTTAGTLSNELAGNPPLTPSSLFDAITGLETQEKEGGVVGAQIAKYLVVAPTNIRNAMQVTQSEFVSNTATNAIEIFSSIYGLQTLSSPYLGTSFGGFGTNQQGFIVLSTNHSATRWEREGISTDLVDYIYQTNDSYIFKGRYRDQYGVMNYIGAYGSDGSGV